MGPPDKDSGRYEEHRLIYFVRAPHAGIHLGQYSKPSPDRDGPEQDHPLEDVEITQEDNRR